MCALNLPKFLMLNTHIILQTFSVEGHHCLLCCSRKNIMRFTHVPKGKDGLGMGSQSCSIEIGSVLSNVCYGDINIPLEELQSLVLVYLVCNTILSHCIMS